MAEGIASAPSVVSALIIRENKAATKIQAIIRGWLYRRYVSRIDFEHLCARRIQRAWRSYVVRQVVRDFSVKVAYGKIRKVVTLFRGRKRAAAARAHQASLSPVLVHYPAKSRPTEPQKYTKSMAVVMAEMKKAKRKGVSRRSQDPEPAETQLVASRKESNTKAAKGKTAAVTARGKSQNTSRGDKRAATAKLPVVRDGPPMRRKVFMDLPPPWHGRDPRRLSTTVVEELTFAQKANVQWAKSELMSWFMNECGKQLDAYDEVTVKNDKFVTRTVQKTFIQPLLRTTKPLYMKQPNDMVILKNTGFVVIASTVETVLLEMRSFLDDELVSRSPFENAYPMLDVAVHQNSGFAVGIDTSWVLHLFDQKESVGKLQLKVEKTLPLARKFLFFDHFGMLWVNLFPQKGSLLCVDVLTLQPVNLVSYENLITIQPVLRDMVLLEPLHYREQPWGFAVMCQDQTDVHLFSTDFGRTKKLRHPDMRSFPNVKQVGGRLIVWSEDEVIYVYDIKDKMDGVTLSGSFKVPARPITVCGVSEPDVIYVSLGDATLRTYSATGIQLPSRIPNTKLKFAERTIADKVFGPVTYREGGSAFVEQAQVKFPDIPLRVDACQFNNELSLVMCGFGNGSVSSIWIVNDSVSVHADQYENATYAEGSNSNMRARAIFQDEIGVIHKKDAAHSKLFKRSKMFEEQANRGYLRELFSPGSEMLDVPKLLKDASLRQMFAYLPEPPDHRYLTAYETFHYLQRSGILPSQLSNFAGFLNRYAPADVKFPVGTPTLIVNKMLPVRTSGLYNAVTDVVFKMSEIRGITEEVNPVKGLFERLPKFTISRAIEEGTSAEKTSTQRQWTSRYQQQELQRRLHSLKVIENLCKHELLRRLEVKNNESFKGNLLDKMLPVPAMVVNREGDIRNGRLGSMSPRPNRNPLLDEKRYISVYESWSTHRLFGSDHQGSVELRAMHIPTALFEKENVRVHFDTVRRISSACKYVSNKVFSVEPTPDGETQIVVTESSCCLTLSHFLSVHSYLGENARMLVVLRLTLSKILDCMYQMHKNGSILRTICLENVTLDAANGEIKIGNAFDMQVGDSIYLPLPPTFARTDNPFLPPEYFHVPPSRYTGAFDVWQFGMLLLLSMTGFTPRAYGTVLMEHLSDVTQITSREEEPGMFDDPKLYPTHNVFYDWLKECPIVGPLESWIGHSGECKFSSLKRRDNGTVLEIDEYRLLPYKNTALNYDETKIYLEIITSCLQIDPTKRPTVAELLRTFPFNQVNQAGDIIDQYVRTPNEHVFVSKFFAPALRDLSEAIFPFTLGIVSALFFREEKTLDDLEYAFPLDARAAERTMTALFDLRVLDRLVEYVLERVRTRVQLEDVVPIMKFKDTSFESLVHFFTRFVASVEHGQGVLVAHVDAGIMAMLSLYAGTPFLKISSAHLMASEGDAAKVIQRDSSPMFLYTYTQLHGIVRYALQWNGFIFNSVRRTVDHTDGYFDQFVVFSEAVYSFANSICHSVEKQKTNAIKTMTSLWSGAVGSSTVRLFIDFKVVHKVVHCFHMQSARYEAAVFVHNVLDASKSRVFSPSFTLLRRCVMVPSVLIFCALTLRGSVVGALKSKCLEVIENILYRDYPIDLELLVRADVIWSMAEMARDVQVHTVLSNAITRGSTLFLDIIGKSGKLRRMLTGNGVEFQPSFDMRNFDDAMDLAESLSVLKKLVATLARRRSAYDPECVPTSRVIEYFVKVFAMTVESADAVAKFFDTQVMRISRYEVKESAFMKSKNKEKESAMIVMHAVITEICQTFQQLFAWLCTFWKSGGEYKKDTVAAIMAYVVSAIPACRAIPHPATLIHWTLQRMLVHTLKTTPLGMPARVEVSEKFVGIVLAVMQRDIEYTAQCAEKELDVQLIGRYPMDRRMRTMLFRTLMSRTELDCSPVLSFIVSEMAHSVAFVRVDSTVEQVRAFRYPIRSEAVEFILYVLGNNERYPKAAQFLADEMVSTKFMENERKLTTTCNDNVLVSTSLTLLKAIVTHEDLFNHEFVKSAATHLDNLKNRFASPWNPEIAVSRPTLGPIILNAKGSNRAVTAFAKGRNTSLAGTRHSGPKIVKAPKLSNSYRAATAAGKRK